MRIPAGITWHIIEVPTPDLTDRIPVVLGWMRGVLDRVGPLASMMLGAHKAWIEMIQGMDFTQEEYERKSRRLMEAHAIARNDIYDITMRNTGLNEHGFEDGNNYKVSMKESQLRDMFHLYHERLKDL